MFEFTEEQIYRYSRHILLPEVGVEGQEKIFKGRVLVIGTGGLGSPVSYYLTAAGVGKLGIIDDDVVDISNLQRQILHSTNDIGRPKVESAKEKLNALNPDVDVVAYGFRLNKDNILEIIKDYDIIVDGTDNFATRYLLNDACVMTGKPFVHGGILRFSGQMFTVKPGEGPCFRCIFRDPPAPGEMPTCAEAGVLGAIAGTIGILQATEVLKFLLGKGELLVGRMLTFDALTMKFRELELGRSPDCPTCGDNAELNELTEYELPACQIKDK